MTDAEIKKAIEELKQHPKGTDPRVITILEGLLAAVERRPVQRSKMMGDMSIRP